MASNVHSEGLSMVGSRLVFQRERASEIKPRTGSF